MTRSRDWPFLLFLLVVTIAGLLVTRHYGESWDELLFYKYADHALEAYGTWWQSGEAPSVGNTYDYYGPAFVMGVTLLARGLNVFLPGWLFSDLRHVVYFLTFQIGVLSFHAIARRWLSGRAAFGATLLLITQPVIWGHAFISPKDIPFMAFFLASLALGFKMGDVLATNSTFERLTQNWKNTSRRAKITLLTVTLVWLLSLVILFLTVSQVHGWLANLIRGAYENPQALVGDLFFKAASDAGKVSPEVYIQKAIVLLIRVKLVWLILSTAAMIWWWRKAVPAVRGLLHPVVLLAGVTLGIATSIRVLGPLAGLLVGLYLLARQGKRAIPPLLIYAGIAFAVMYASWPFLWPEPLPRLVESLGVMRQYPWKGQALFNGTFYDADKLPLAYMPVLLAIQFTEPVWLLALAGLVLSLWSALKRRDRSRVEGSVLFVLWFVLPLAGLLASRSPLYDNFRQILFILPPIFLMAGVALQPILEKARKGLLQAVILAALLLPGLCADVRLHPYQYIYYNSYVGGVEGAFRRFELDYWCTSYRQAADYVNRVAAPNARVMVIGPNHIFETYARDDLSIFSDSEDDLMGNYDYAVITTRYDLDLETYAGAKIISVIQKDGAALTVIKQLAGP